MPYCFLFHYSLFFFLKQDMARTKIQSTLLIPSSISSTHLNFPWIHHWDWGLQLQWEPLKETGNQCQLNDWNRACTFSRADAAAQHNHRTHVPSISAILSSVDDSFPHRDKAGQTILGIIYRHSHLQGRRKLSLVQLPLRVRNLKHRTFPFRMETSPSSY